MCNNSHCQAHLLADLLKIPFMYILALWNNFLKKKKKKKEEWHGCHSKNVIISGTM